MDKLENDVVTKAERAVETVLNNMLPMPRCNQEKQHVKAKREKVKAELAIRFGAIGPSEVK